MDHREPVSFDHADESLSPECLDLGRVVALSEGALNVDDRRVQVVPGAVRERPDGGAGRADDGASDVVVQGRDGAEGTHGRPYGERKFYPPQSRNSP